MEAKGRLIAKLDALSFYKYLSHKYLRWLAGYFLAVGAAASVGIVLVAFGTLPSLIYLLLLAAAGFVADRFNLPVVTSLWEIIVAMWATAIGVYKSLRGEPGSERERVVIERQVSHLTRLVDDLLDVSRIARTTRSISLTSS